MTERTPLRPSPTPSSSFIPARDGSLQRRCACGGNPGPDGECAGCRRKRLHRRATSQAAPATVPPIVNEVLQSPGQPLDTATREFMEPRFGHDFSKVRVHADARAAESARAVNALAYTVGRDVVFGSGQYAPRTSAGRRLLAHELTHTVQQHGSRGIPQLAPSPGHTGGNDLFEQEAQQATDALAGGDAVSVRLKPSVPVIQRQAVPTGIKLAETKPFGHADLKNDESKKKFRTYLGSTTLMQVTPAGNYKGHCTKEYLTEVANTCPTRFSELRTGSFCTGNKCLEFDRWGSSGDAETGKMVTDGPDTFIDRHRTRHDQSLLEGTGKDQCSVVCHQRYKYDRKNDLGSFYIIRNFRAGKFTPTGSKDSLHVTTGEVQKVPAALEAPSTETFAKDVAPGLKKGGSLAEPPPVPKDSGKKK
jgi:hypothetical protein